MNEIIRTLEHDLEQITTTTPDLHEQCELSAACCRKYLNRLQEKAIKEGFADERDLWAFRREQLPYVLGNWIYYREHYTVLGKLPSGPAKRQAKYLDKAIRDRKDYMDRHQGLYRAHKHGGSTLEAIYLNTENNPPCLDAEPYCLFSIPGTTTCNDTVLATLLAYERLIATLQEEIARLSTNGAMLPGTRPRPKLRWTGKTIDLGELIYGLVAEGCVNHGEVEIRELTQALLELFETKMTLKDVYNCVGEMKKRKDNPVRFFNRCGRALTQYLDGLGPRRP